MLHYPLDVHLDEKSFALRVVCHHYHKEIFLLFLNHNSHKFLLENILQFLGAPFAQVPQHVFIFADVHTLGFAKACQIAWRFSSSGGPQGNIGQTLLTWTFVNLAIVFFCSHARHMAQGALNGLLGKGLSGLRLERRVLYAIEMRLSPVHFINSFKGAGSPLHVNPAALGISVKFIRFGWVAFQ